MKRLTPLSVASINLFFAVLLTVCAVVLFWGSSVDRKFAASIRNGPDVAQALYAAGRYDLLRDNAVNCNRQFNDLAVNVIESRGRFAIRVGILLVSAVVFFLFNVVILRRMASNGHWRSNQGVQGTPAGAGAPDA